MPIWPFQRPREDQDGEALLDAVSRASRNVAIYGPGRLADTLEGRFEALTLFACLALTRLRAEAGAQPLAQSFTDALFSQLDAGLREAAVGDLSVPKRMHRLAGAFYGRLSAYEAALQNQDGAALALAIGRNALGGENAAFAASLSEQALVLAAKQAKAPMAALTTAAAWTL